MPKSGFSWKRLFGISTAKTRIARMTGIPLTKSGRKRKRNALIARLFGLK